MSNLLALLFCVTVTQNDYATAYENSLKDNKPLVVLVGAEWCPGCVKLKNQIIPNLPKETFDNVAFGVVDTDTDPDLAHTLLRGDSIPQIVKFEKKNGKWVKSNLVGSNSSEQVKAFIKGK